MYRLLQCRKISPVPGSERYVAYPDEYNINKPRNNRALVLKQDTILTHSKHITIYCDLSNVHSELEWRAQHLSYSHTLKVCSFFQRSFGSVQRQPGSGEQELLLCYCCQFLVYLDKKCNAQTECLCVVSRSSAKPDYVGL